jgi:uncharacterized protein YpmB
MTAPKLGQALTIQTQLSKCRQNQLYNGKEVKANVTALMVKTSLKIMLVPEAMILLKTSTPSLRP